MDVKAVLLGLMATASVSTRRLASPLPPRIALAASGEES